MSRGHASPRAFYVDKLAEGVATIAAAFWPKKVIVRLSDFKSNEYKKLIGGSRYEPDEENPMLGLRGASRYLAPEFAECFEMECTAMKRVRDDMGLTNVELMVPFVRTLTEAAQVIALLGKNGLERGATSGDSSATALRIVMMCELPSNAMLADEFLEHFDGFSIGSNDLTQLTLGLDRDSGLVAEGFDERDPAVTAMLQRAIQACISKGKYCGICGQGPSDHPDFAEWLMKRGHRVDVAESGHGRRRRGSSSRSCSRPESGRPAALPRTRRASAGGRSTRDASHGVRLTKVARRGSMIAAPRGSFR